MRRWTIRQVSKALVIPPSKIRYWERHIPQLQIPRDARGRRYFTDREMQLLQLIYHLRVEKKIPLDQVGAILEDHHHPYRREYKLAQSLKAVRQFLVDLMAEIDKS